jgi:hypothetical protein
MQAFAILTRPKPKLTTKFLVRIFKVNNWGRKLTISRQKLTRKLTILVLPLDQNSEERAGGDEEDELDAERESEVLGKGGTGALRPSHLRHFVSSLSTPLFMDRGPGQGDEN